MEENLKDLGLGKEFLALRTKAWSIKEKMDKLDLIKNKTFCFAKDPVNRMKRHWECLPFPWEKLGEEYMGSLCIIYYSCMKSTVI